MSDLEEMTFARQEPEATFLGFALSECTIEVCSQSLKYLGAVHRTALELAVPNRFGLEIGGFWLSTDQIAQLRALSEYYPANEASLVAQVIEAYLKEQLGNDILTSPAFAKIRRPG